MRTISTSVRTANTMPTPNSLMVSTPLVPIAASGTHISTAALTTRRPMDPSPVATASVLSPRWSYCSRIRDTRNTS